MLINSDDDKFFKIENIILTSKLVTFTKRISRELCEKLGTHYDDPDDKWINSKVQEIVKDIMEVI